MNWKDSLRIPEDFSLRLWGYTATACNLAGTALWVEAWYDQVIPTNAGWLQLTVFFTLTMLGSIFLARNLYRTGGPWFDRRVFLPIWILACLAASLPIVLYAGKAGSWQELFRQSFYANSGAEGNRLFIHLLVIILMIWRAAALARYPISLEVCLKSFRFGLIAFFIFGLTYSLKTPRYIILSYFIFLIISLICLTTARVADVGTARGGRLPSLNSRRLASLSGIAVLIASVAILAARGIGQPVAAALAGAIIAFTGAALMIIIEVLSPLLNILLEAVYRFGVKIFAVLPELFHRDFQTPEQIPDLHQPVEGLSGQAGMLDISKIIAAAVLVSATVLIFLLLRRKAWQSKGILLEETSEKSDRVQRQQWKIKSPFQQSLKRIFQPGRVVAAARVRQIYSELCDLCARLGKPRRLSQTPIEFLPTMANLFPDNQIGLEQITSAYLQVRYGLYPENEVEIKLVEDAWAEIKRKGIEKLTELKK